MFLVSFENAGKVLTCSVLNKVTIGRLPNCDIVVDCPFVSRCHCTIYLEIDPLRCLIVDGEIFGSRSSFGTYVNGQRIFRYELKNGDEITFSRNKSEPRLKFIDLSPIETEVSTGDF